MDAIREIIAGTRLAGVIDLPAAFKTSELEVIILPLGKKKKKKSTKKIQATPSKLEDLPKHKMGKELSKVKKTNSRQDLITLMKKGIYTLPDDFILVREELYD